MDEARAAVRRACVENNAQALRDSPDIGHVLLNRIINTHQVLACYDRGEPIAELMRWRD